MERVVVVVMEQDGRQNSVVAVGMELLGRVAIDPDHQTDIAEKVLEELVHDRQYHADQRPQYFVW